MYYLFVHTPHDDSVSKEFLSYCLSCTSASCYESLQRYKISMVRANIFGMIMNDYSSKY